MSTKYYNGDGTLALELAESVMELPWFVKVAKESEELLDRLYQLNPSLCSAWYREQKEKAGK